MEISRFKHKGTLVIDRQSATILLAEFLSYRSAAANPHNVFSLEDKEFRKFVGVAKTFADKWGIPFDPALYTTTMIVMNNETPKWNSSTGDCGWINAGEVGDY